MRLVDTSHLKEWAGTEAAKSRLPGLVKDLILGSVNPKHLRFPTGDSVWIPGFDGRIFCAEESRFVPKGESCWEVSKSQNSQAKAEENFEKRSAASQETPDPRSLATFVFVTPHVWAGKDDWAASKVASGPWGAVQVIDGEDLKDWLEDVLPVHLAFAAELGRVPGIGLRHLEAAWKEWSRKSNPQISPELVLAGRREEEKAFRTRLLSLPPSVVVIQAESEREAYGFALAALMRMKAEPDGELIEARTLVADDEVVMRDVQILHEHFVVHERIRDLASDVHTDKGCHLVYPVGNEAQGGRTPIVLPLPGREDFTGALLKQSIDRELAERMASECGRSVTIFQRRYPAVNVKAPAWSDRPDISALLPAVLAGRWDESSPLDKEILCLLSGKSTYDEVVDSMQPFLDVDDPPIRRIGSVWILASHVDSFHLTAKRIQRSHLEAFAEGCKKVFEVVDPAVSDTTDGGRGGHAFLPGEPEYSETLKAGLAETLLLISQRGDAAGIRVPTPGGPGAYVDSVARGLDGRGRWQTIASLRDYYARLVEAAPDPFVEGLEQMLEERPEDALKLFKDPGFFGGSHYHVGVLWGLECLAWIPDYFLRAVRVLSKLASIDPGGNLHNRPINSLGEIFLWWLPNTCASTADKLRALDQIDQISPGVCWGILVRQLPTSLQSLSHMTSKPKFRDPGRIPAESEDRAGQLRYLEGIVDRAIAKTGVEVKRWETMLRSLKHLSPAHQETLLVALEALPGQLSESSKREEFWKLLLHETHRHARFRNQADWTWSIDISDRVQGVADMLKPDDLVSANRWLFDVWLPDVASDTGEYADQIEAADAARMHAFAQIFERKGIEGVKQLALGAKFPELVARPASDLLKSPQDAFPLIDLVPSEHPNRAGFIFSISALAREKFNGEWVDSIATNQFPSGWSPVDVASLCLPLADVPQTWEMVQGFGAPVHDSYWGRKPFSHLDRPVDEVRRSVEKFIEVGRACTVFDRLTYSADNIPSDILLIVFDAAMAEVSQVKTVDEFKSTGMNADDIQRFLENLANRTDIPREVVAQREYLAIPMISPLEVSGLVIQDEISKDPDLFVKLLSDVFRPDSSVESPDVPEAETENPEEAKARALIGYRLLNGMTVLPGQSGEDTFDIKELFAWTQKVREMSQRVGRLAVADQRIGQILSHAPTDPSDHLWPHSVVRMLIDSLSSEDIERGFAIGRYNQRGVVHKGIYEGGDQERAMARQFAQWAEALSFAHPRTSNALRMLVQSYERDAEHSDQSSKLRQST